MDISRRMLLAVGGATVAAGSVSRVLAQTPAKPMIIFDEGFRNDWSNTGWANVKQPVSFDGQTTLKVEGGPWSAVVFHHAPISLSGFSKLTFMVNGGDGGGFTMWLRGFLDGKPIDCDFQVKPIANRWTSIDAPLAALKLDGQRIDSFALQAADTTYKPYYIAKVQLG